jgi:hypothetical protein
MEALENGKSANQIWKECGTTLSFKDWIQREKDKGRFLPNRLLQGSSISVDDNLNVGGDSVATGNDRVDQLINNVLDGSPQMRTDTKKSNEILGLNKWVLILSATIVIGAVAYKIYQNKKSE